MPFYCFCAYAILIDVGDFVLDIDSDKNYKKRRERERVRDGEVLVKEGI